MKTYNEMISEMNGKGFEMKQSISGYYYCIHNDEDGVERTVWMDSACEDAYDLETATAIAYPMCEEWEEEHPYLFMDCPDTDEDEDEEETFDINLDKCVLKKLCQFLINGPMALRIVLRTEIEGENAQLIRFVFGNCEQTCVAVVYADGSIFTPDDWQTPIWDNEDWTIEDSQWMDSDFNECVVLNGLPRKF